jgi:hypothetical protein
MDRTGAGVGAGAGLEESAKFNKQSKIDTYSPSAFIYMCLSLTGLMLAC